MSEELSPRNFYAFFRSEFSFLEADDGPNPYFNIMTAFYEKTFSRSYPWLRCCGFWNAFVRLDLNWDARDDLFLLTVSPSSATPLTRNKVAPTSIDAVLDAVKPDWREGCHEVRPACGVAAVQFYAKAIKPLATKLFLPVRVPSHGLAGFSWISKITSAAS